MSRLRLGELFAGYGGLGLAVESVFDAELAWVSEIEKGPSAVLAHRWPHVPNHGDVTRIDWAAVERVDILSGGSPCQDLSFAGARRGMTTGTRSNLWESMREAVAVIRPRYVVWENVKGALSATAISASDMGHTTGSVAGGSGHLRALGRVLGDLSDLGYDAEWRCVRASDVGAPHGRLRVFLLATDRNHLGEHRPGQRSTQNRGGQPQNSNLPSADADHQGSQGQHHSSRATPAERPGHTSQGVDWGKYTGAIRRWEALYGAAPSPVELSPSGKPRLSAVFAEWMMGLPAGWVTDVPGLAWSEQVKACGNGVVPAQAAAALRSMLLDSVA